MARAIMNNFKKILSLWLLFSCTNLMNGILITDNFIAPRHITPILQGDKWFAGYCSFVTIAAIGCAYVTYQCLKSARSIRSFIWREINLSSEEHNFKPLNKWSREHLHQLSFSHMQSVMHMFLLNLLLDTVIREQAQEWQYHKARMQVLQRFNLYQFAHYRKLIRKFPEYGEHISQTIALVNNNPAFKDLLLNLQGFASGEFIGFLLREARIVQTKEFYENKSD